MLPVAALPSKSSPALLEVYRRRDISNCRFGLCKVSARKNGTNESVSRLQVIAPNL